MKLSENVKIKPLWWNIVPWLKYTALAIYPNIYFSKEHFQKFRHRNPRPELVAALIHEQEHIKRQKKGWFKWGIKYVFSAKFRFNEELEAIRSSIKYLKKKGIGFDIEKQARVLSGWLYFWPVSFKTAKRELEKAWGEI